jgi:ribosome-associated translation inhibitor RaiA
MQIDIQTRGFTLTRGLREHAERRLRFAFSPARPEVLRIAVRLSDQNGPRGGEDKRCRIQVTFAGVPGVVIEDTEADLYVAIDRAADRAGRTVARRIARRREHRGPAADVPAAADPGPYWPPGPRQAALPARG